MLFKIFFLLSWICRSRDTKHSAPSTETPHSVRWVMQSCLETGTEASCQGKQWRLPSPGPHSLPTCPEQRCSLRGGKRKMKRKRPNTSIPVGLLLSLLCCAQTPCSLLDHPGSISASLPSFQGAQIPGAARVACCGLNSAYSTTPWRHWWFFTQYEACVHAHILTN